jgi:hypothetical protein
MNESIVRFGPGEILVGVLSMPEGVPSNGPVVVMWNVGLNHHVGPSRIWVELARRLARQGIASFRFDMSGLGDSAQRDDLVGDLERAVLDLEEALAWLAQHVSSDFVLVSNCSGTDNSHEVALRDERVRAAAFLDGYTYVTPRLLLHQHVLRFFQPTRYRRALMRRYPRWFGFDLGNRAAGGVDEIYKRQYPTREKFEADLAQMVDRGAQLLFTFSSESMYAYKRQFWDWLERKDWGTSISVEFYREASHTYSFKDERETLLRRMTEWIVALPPRSVEDAASVSSSVPSTLRGAAHSHVAPRRQQVAVAKEQEAVTSETAAQLAQPSSVTAAVGSNVPDDGTGTRVA